MIQLDQERNILHLKIIFARSGKLIFFFDSAHGRRKTHILTVRA